MPIILGNDGSNDLVTGTDGADELDGLTGDDILRGQKGDDVIRMGSNLWYYAGPEGGDRNDPSLYQLATDDDIANGGGGSDWFVMGVGNDAVYGGTAVVSPDPYIDTIDFSAVLDQLDVTPGGVAMVTVAFAGLTVDLAQETWTGRLKPLSAFGLGERYSGIASGIEQVIGSQASDTLLGSDRDEIFVPNGGSDYVDGAGGTDTITYADTSDPVALDLSHDQATFRGKTSTVLNVEHFIGGSGADSFGGSSRDEYFIGNAGADHFVSGGGEDTIDYGHEGGGSGVRLTVGDGTATVVDTWGDTNSLEGKFDVILTDQNDWVFSRGSKQRPRSV